MTPHTAVPASEQRVTRESIDVTELRVAARKPVCQSRPQIRGVATPNRRGVHCVRPSSDFAQVTDREHALDVDRGLRSIIASTDHVHIAVIEGSNPLFLRLENRTHVRGMSHDRTSVRPTLWGRLVGIVEKQAGRLRLERIVYFRALAPQTEDAWRTHRASREAVPV
jgi:hypothetical protein